MSAPRCQDALRLKGRPGGSRGVVRTHRKCKTEGLLTPICHQKFQFPENSMPSSALRKEVSAPVGLGIMVAGRSQRNPCGLCGWERKAIYENKSIIC